MGKSSAQKLQQFARFIAANKSNKPLRPTQLNPVSKARPITYPDPTARRPESLKPNVQQMGAAPESSIRRHLLSEVVADCVKRWFQDTLKEAKAGDTAMQVLVGQMYYSGYGVVRDPHKGRAWISRASKIRSSALKVGDKRPGYNASDSDSDEVAENAK